MSRPTRNFKPTYLKKLRDIDANGFRFDIANYLHNPAYGYDYPRFRKEIDRNAIETTYCDIYYFKYYDGTGEYIKTTYKAPNNGNEWVVVNELTREVLANSNRFNLETLLSFCRKEGIA